MNEGFSGNTYGANFDPVKLGFPSSLVGQFAVLEFPRFNVQNYSVLGSNGVYDYTTQDFYSLQPGMSWIRGKHFLHFGGDVRRYNDNRLSAGLASGTVSGAATLVASSTALLMLGAPRTGPSPSGCSVASMKSGPLPSVSIGGDSDAV